MKAVYLHFIRDLLNVPQVRSAFCDILALRQSCYMPVNPNILVLDPLDLISTHVILYEPESSGILGAMRIVHASICHQLKQAFPIEQIIKASGLDAHRQAYELFESSVPDVKQIALLCVDPKARWSTSRSPVTEALHWLSARWILNTGNANFCGLVNKRFKGQRWLKCYGDWQALPDVTHPLVPDPHELAIIPSFNSAYIESKRANFGSLYDTAAIFDGTSKSDPLWAA